MAGVRRQDGLYVVATPLPLGPGCALCACHKATNVRTIEAYSSTFNALAPWFEIAKSCQVLHRQQVAFDTTRGVHTTTSLQVRHANWSKARGIPQKVESSDPLPSQL